MTSPSISSTKRSTPCAAGCCGPKLTVKRSISGIARILERGRVAVVVANHLRHDGARLDAHRLVHDAPLLRVVAHLDVAAHWEILTERMSDETVIGQDAAKIGMTAEQDPEQVERLPFVPIRRAPDAGDRVEDRMRIVLAERPKAHTPVVRDRQKLIDDREAVLRTVTRRVVVVLLGREDIAVAEHAAAEARAGRAFRLPLVAAVDEIIDAGEIDQHLEPERLVVAQRPANVEQMLGLDLVRQLPRVQPRRQPLDAAGERPFYRFGKRGEPRRKLFSSHVVPSQPWSA